MAATPTTPRSDERTEPRFTREPPPGGPPPSGPPERPGRGLGVLVLVAVLVIGALIATGLVLLGGGSPSSSGRAAPRAQAPATRPAAPTAAATAPAGAARSIAVTLKEFSVTPQPGAGRAGRVTFHVRNAGRITHEFVVLRTNTPAGRLAKGGRADESGNVGEVGDLQPGASRTLALSLRPGHYALVCNLPGHYLAGQHADFTVR
jgi:uncharacterized cupredoxin-like copper-binding protein